MKIILKNSNTLGKIPLVSDLDLGEVGINTTDGRIFIKKDNGVESIVEVGANSGGGTSTGLEKITENAKSGWRLVGENPLNHGDIGTSSVDLAVNPISSTTIGATGDQSFAAGYMTTASSQFSTAFGKDTLASGICSVAVGYATTASGGYSDASGNNTIASGICSTSRGYYATASGTYSVSVGYHTTAGGNHSMAGGYYSTSTGQGSFAFGHTDNNTTYITASGDGSSVIGSSISYATLEASGPGSHTTGYAHGDTDYSTEAQIIASGLGSHAEGYVHSTYNTNTSIAYAETTTASGLGSHAEGRCTTALNEASHAEGKYNIGTATDTIHETGIGTDVLNKKNAFEIYTDGRIHAPELTIALHDTPSSLTTKEYVDAETSLSIQSDVTGIPGATQIINDIFLSQADYDALGTYDNNTRYSII